MSAPAIQTWYAGYRFRSRLEARWAVFFKAMGIDFEYEHQGFLIGVRPYLPDFYLPDCGTWIEVKGNEEELDHDLMFAAAEHLPGMTGNGEQGPRLLILGPIPEPPEQGDLGWTGIDTVRGSFEDGNDPDEVFQLSRWWGFGAYHKKRRPWILCNTSTAPPPECVEVPWLSPAVDVTEPGGAADAYRAARSARFEHGESGAPR